MSYIIFKDEKYYVKEKSLDLNHKSINDISFYWRI